MYQIILSSSGPTLTKVALNFPLVGCFGNSDAPLQVQPGCTITLFVTQVKSPQQESNIPCHPWLAVGKDTDLFCCDISHAAFNVKQYDSLH